MSVHGHMVQDTDVAHITKDGSCNLTLVYMKERFFVLYASQDITVVNVDTEKR